MRVIAWVVVVATVVAAIPVRCYSAKRIAAADPLGGRVEVTCVDAETGSEIPRPYVTAAPIDKPLPPGQSPFRLESVIGKTNTFLSTSLPPGRYQLLAERTARNADDVRYESDRPVMAEVNAGETTYAVVRVSKRGSTSKEIAERWPWEVYGRVTDPSGGPVAGAVVRAHSGMGTIPCTGATLTDTNGKYRLHFTNGGMILDKRAVYYAQITASKPGMYERNLNLQGELAAAEPDAVYGQEFFRPEQFIYQLKPRRIDFVLAPAADLQVQIHTERRRDEKLDGLRVSLKGKVMPPGCSVVDDRCADRWGWIAFAGVPLDHEWFLEIESDDAAVRSQPFRLTASQQYAITLRWRRDATGLDLLDVESIDDALGRDVTLQLAGDDPLTHPPAPAAEQREARKWLRRIAVANRDWLDQPAEAVTEYSYDFVMNDKTQHPYIVPRDRRVAGVVLQGIAFVSVAKRLTENPENVVVRQVDRSKDRVTFSYSLLEPSNMSAGNGVLNSYHGFFSMNFREGTLAFDPMTYRVLECRTKTVTERFSDYFELANRRHVPRLIEIEKGTELRHRWKFAVYEPGLWLFDESMPPQQDDAPYQVRITNVSINGGAARKMTSLVGAPTE